MIKMRSRFLQITITLLLFSMLGIQPAIAQDDSTYYLDSQFALMRFNVDGSIDTSFGSGGKILTDFASAVTEWATSVTLTGSGKIVVAGTAFVNDFGYIFALARYNPDGSLDTSFDEDGKVLTEISSTSEEVIEGVVMAGGGKIVAAGWGTMNGGGVFALARYNSDGSLDTTFDGDGKVLTDFVVSTDERVQSVSLDANGQIVVGGWATVNGNHVFALARYNADGSLDHTFQGGGAGPGKVLTDIQDSIWGSTNDEMGEALAVRRDGLIVLGGTAQTSDSGSVMALARYFADGSLDTSFSEDGYGVYDWYSQADDHLADIALPGNGQVLMAGSAVDARGSIFALARINADGWVDQNGTLTNINASSEDRLNAVAITDDNHIVAGGTGLLDGSHVFALARYNADGTLDGTFVGTGSSQGKILAGFPNTHDDELYDLVIDDSGRIIAVGAAGTLAPPLRYPN